MSPPPSARRFPPTLGAGPARRYGKVRAAAPENYAAPRRAPPILQANANALRMAPSFATPWPAMS